ncbi:hypothetical protein, variant [Exophiala mesophila]|uniref:Signal recognition particle subunit SRP68 n=1 Tax=Exophiala mesophila TaxID=212818 RepID=A0A0D1X619_EXOME|nr:hypothetical protein, variant [Exophiala mesophila]KIV97250.1 hypothetical protein, variant [Exophiala mesophila]
MWPKIKSTTVPSVRTRRWSLILLRWVQLLLASSERAWADAMAMKAAQSQENTQKPMPGSTKQQISSRLRRAIQHAENLVEVLQDLSATGATPLDVLEAAAYRSMMKGSLDFEKAKWQQCLQDYAVTYIIYAALARGSKTDIYKDLLSSIVEPSIRYASYQLQISRTKAVGDIAIENFPQSNSLRKEIESVNSLAFQKSSDLTANKDGPKEVPSNISWRNRKVKLEDANISQALGISKEREEDLTAKFHSFEKGELDAKEFATLYEDVITARQDAADATKTAIDEMLAEGVDPGDSRIQSLQITRTAVNYAVIEWRVGRNRVLTGPNDGLLFEPESGKRQLKPRKDGKDRAPKEESAGRQMSRLRERVALFDLVLQSLDSVKELPGVVADTEFVQELEAKRNYFRALKLLNLGRSHAINEQIANALALYARAQGLAQTASLHLQSSPQDSGSPPKLDVSSEQIESLVTTLNKLVIQYRALAELKALTPAPSTANAQPTSTATFKPAPLIERLHRNEFVESVDLTNLVNYPPKLRPVPVKPLFFDLAWNYINYPGQNQDDASTGEAITGASAGKANGDAGAIKTEEAKPAKKGWFGFGR